MRFTSAGIAVCATPLDVSCLITRLPRASDPISYCWSSSYKPTRLAAPALPSPSTTQAAPVQCATIRRAARLTC